VDQQASEATNLDGSSGLAILLVSMFTAASDIR
jgi:hypothetical protein